MNFCQALPWKVHTQAQPLQIGTDSSGSALSDTNLDTETKSIIIDQKIFQGFQGYNFSQKIET